MALYDLLGGSNSSDPLFLGSTYAGALDYISPADFQQGGSQKAQSAGVTPELSALKDMLPSDTHFFEQRRNKGLAGIQKLTQEYGGDVRFAYNDPRFREYTAMVNPTQEEINRALQEKKSFDEWNGKVRDKNATEQYDIDIFDKSGGKIRRKLGDATTDRFSMTNYEGQRMQGGSGIPVNYQQSIADSEMLNKDYDQLLADAVVGTSTNKQEWYDSVKGQPLTTIIASAPGSDKLGYEGVTKRGSSYKTNEGGLRETAKGMFDRLQGGSQAALKSNFIKKLDENVHGAKNAVTYTDFKRDKNGVVVNDAKGHPLTERVTKVISDPSDFERAFLPAAFEHEVKRRIDPEVSNSVDFQKMSDITSPTGKDGLSADGFGYMTALLSGSVEESDSKTPTLTMQSSEDGKYVSQFNLPESVKLPVYSGHAFAERFADDFNVKANAGLKDINSIGSAFKYQGVWMNAKDFADAKIMEVKYAAQDIMPIKDEKKGFRNPKFEEVVDTKTKGFLTDNIKVGLVMRAKIFLPEEGGAANQTNNISTVQSQMVDGKTKRTIGGLTSDFSLFPGVAVGETFSKEKYMKDSQGNNVPMAGETTFKEQKGRYVWVDIKVDAPEMLGYTDKDSKERDFSRSLYFRQKQGEAQKKEVMDGNVLNYANPKK